MSTLTLANARTYLETICNIPSGDGFVGSTEELNYLNIGYERTAYRYNWPQLLRRGASIIVANVQSYALPSDFRKFRHMFVLGIEYKETEYENFPYSRNKYAVDVNSSFNDFWISTRPTTASTAYALTNNESAGNAVVIELDSVSGLAAGDEIFVNGTTPEFTIVSSVDTSAKAITARLKAATGASKSLYRSIEIITYQYYRVITLLSATGDTILLPDQIDYIYPHYAAYLYFTSREQFDRAQKQLELWDERLKDAWLSADLLSTGAATSLSL